MRTVLKKIGLVLFGFIVAFTLLEIGLRIAGYVALSSQKDAARRGLDFDDENQYRILCLGESTTAQIIVPGKGGSWPIEMEKILNAEEKGPRKYKSINNGIPGTVTAFIMSELEGNLDRYRPHMVISMMGINDRASVVTFDDKPAHQNRMFLERFRVVKFLRIFANAARHGFQKEEREPPPVFPFVDEPELILQLKDKVRGADIPGAKAVIAEMLRRHPKEEKSINAIYANTYYHAFRTTLVVTDEVYKDAMAVLNRSLEDDQPRGNRSGIAYAAMSFMHIRRQELDKFFETSRLAIKYLEGEDQKYYYIANYIRVAKEHNRKDPYIDELRRKYSITLAGEGRYTATRKHYKMMYRILKERGIKYAAMQYPTLDVRLLKYFFSDDRIPEIDNGQDGFFSSKPPAKYDAVLKDDPNIIFISNEESFNTALTAHPYEYLFVDRFGGTFGHTTPEGHHLIGETAAKALRASGILSR